MKVLGSIDYVYVDDKVRIKLDNKSKKTIFFSYVQKSKEFKLYNLNEEKMVISKDVEFNKEGS